MKSNFAFEIRISFNLSLNIKLKKLQFYIYILLFDIYKMINNFKIVMLFNSEHSTKPKDPRNSEACSLLI